MGHLGRSKSKDGKRSEEHSGNETEEHQEEKQHKREELGEGERAGDKRRWRRPFIIVNLKDVAEICQLGEVEEAGMKEGKKNGRVEPSTSQAALEQRERKGMGV